MPITLDGVYDDPQMKITLMKVPQCDFDLLVF